MRQMLKRIICIYYDIKRMHRFHDRANYNKKINNKNKFYVKKVIMEIQ
jgi:hypothetical protein